MSVDTRTPRTPDPSGRRPGFGDESGLSTVKVPSDPAEVVVTHASFRVQLAVPPGAEPGPSPAAVPVPARSMAAGAAGTHGATGPAGPSGPSGPSGTAGPSRTSVDWETAEQSGVSTQVLPRIEEAPASQPVPLPVPPTVVGPRSPRPTELAPAQQPLLGGVRPARGAFDEYEEEDDGAYEDGAYEPSLSDAASTDETADVPGPPTPDSRRQAYYPGRRMSLGVVLLPLRIFLGLISVYAGMGKLCDPVYFDGASRGSMVTWLRSLDPWVLASPLRDFALAHPVGSGLTVAFLQIVIGVLTVCGLWQRAAAAVGALLSAALLTTVSWSSGPAYEAPDIIYLAAWSPLVIAGAPVYSVDGRLAADAWRTLGPRAELRELRSRVLRRGTLLAAVVTGLALLTGSMLGGAVRAAHTAKIPEPGDPPVNRLPGSPMPETPGSGSPSSERTTEGPTRGASAGPSAGRHSGKPSKSPRERRHSGERSRPSQRQSPVPAPQRSAPQAPPQQQPAPAPGTSGTDGTTSGTAGTGRAPDSSSTGGGSYPRNGSTSGGGGLGGLLG